jgi:hypothetical protein
MSTKEMGITNDKYYKNFSKFLLTDHVGSSCKKYKETVSYSEWEINNNSIENVSLQVLKNTLKSQNCHVSGKKRQLIIRLTKHYLQIQSAILIQRIFRGFLVREMESARGPAYKSRSSCINETDFETMDPLDEIPREYFFSYRDPGGFVYGFNLFSLIAMFRRDRHLVNPYNREDISFDVLQKLFSVYKKTTILYPLNIFTKERII